VLPPVAQRAIRPSQSENEKYRARSFMKDLPSGAPERAKEAARLGGCWSSALHELILAQNLRGKLLITPGYTRLVSVAPSAYNSDR
jgi:hypothetical protein